MAADIWNRGYVHEKFGYRFVTFHRICFTSICMKTFLAAFAGRVALPISLFCFSLTVMVAHAGGTVTNGYITAVLRSECASAPTPPPPVGSTTVGSDFVI